MFQQLIREDAYLEVTDVFASRLLLKIEGLNPAGSIKLKTALSLISDLERRNLISANSRLIESSSGNLGAALAMVCAERRYRFVCVVDPNISIQNRKLISALGAEIITVDQRDENGGYLSSRIRLIEQLVAENSDYIWLNQYKNPANSSAHYETTAKAIAEKFPHIDYLFIGAGTTGTLMGCSAFFSQHRPETKIIAVDSVGSVTFGGAGGSRHIPGLGTSRKPELFNPEGIHAFLSIPEAQAVRMCRWLAQSYGVLLGGSTGTVVAGVSAYADKIRSDDVVVAISPDMGERYLDTIYSDDWVLERFGNTALQTTPL
ncbi:2,3-diaminopropionate biosynthesis protein SbnA (plasmid) [Rhizobium sp. CB3171]|uniref:2,3-diaminopropionate biosynthesis protein SbnA n=1 Tax=Rhizobium sp. CB3171 TaxID=3039157 RepID=UPI0024B17CDE|nr:2,3-diaminopropionate biosynthesis protein SbnA [Rhizobium sp. CB3171]WFU04566.1 2,3-diaminopropionate biosynthesis protein SbnA [Rhizobium sp. CB3171]